MMKVFALQRGRCMAGRINRRVNRIATAWLIWLGLTLAGCGGGSSPSGEPTEPRARASSARAPAAAAAAAGAGGATETFYSEGGKLMRADENVTALGNDLFGDRVNLYNGALEFVQTDVSLPGNSGLPVSVGRRLVTGQSERVQGHFGDWELEIPRMQGVFSQRIGWKVGFGMSDATGARCSQFGKPPQVLGQNNQGAFNPEEYWHGTFLYVPGAGSQELLLPDTSTASVQPTGAALGNPKLTTKDRWLIYCTPLQGGGEGFTAVSPDGTSYRFDWMVSRPYASLTRAVGTAPQLAAAAQGQPTGASGSAQGPVDFAASYLLPRREIWILPSEVRDRFGNTVTYTYNGWQVLKITSTDQQGGAVRTLSFEYESGPTGPTSRVSRVTDGTREWRYTYRDVAYGQGFSLATVSIPGGGMWTMDMNAIATPGDIFGGGGACDSATGNVHSETTTSYLTTGQMTHPSGAKGTFRAGLVTHGRSQVERACRGDDWDGTGWAFYPVASEVFSIRSKTITGPGLPAADLTSVNPGGYTWTYRYGPHNASFAPCAGCPDTKWVTVTDPDQVLTRYTFGIKFRQTEGQLQTVEEGIKDGGAPLRTTVKQYVAPDAGPYPSYIGTSIQQRTWGDLSMRHTPEKLRTITQQDAKFNWRADNFDRLARPRSVGGSNLPRPRS